MGIRARQATARWTASVPALPSLTEPAGSGMTQNGSPAGSRSTHQECTCCTRSAPRSSSLTTWRAVPGPDREAVDLRNDQPQQRRRRSRGRKWLVWIVVIVVVLVGLDFGAKTLAESKIASQIQSNGFPAKPSVSIAGFPFLTQAAARDIHQITISSSNIKKGPVTITSLNVVADNVKVNSSFNGGTTGPVHGTVLISLGALGNTLSQAGPLAGFLGGGGLKVVSVGNTEVKGSLNL